MILVFRTTYLDENGDEIDDSRMIAMNYLKQRFIIDFLCTFPFDSFTSLFLTKN